MSFKEFYFYAKIDDRIPACGFAIPTTIRTKSILPIFTSRDVLGLVQICIVKTVAFILSFLRLLLDDTRKRMRAITIAPTRRLAEQGNELTRKLAKKTSPHSGVSKQQVRVIAPWLENKPIPGGCKSARSGFL